MKNNKKILAVIPARGGSKGVPRKNIKLINGKPLLVWSVLAAKNSKYIDKIIVSTEDKEIAGIASAAGAEILDRPVRFATDGASNVQVLQHAISKLPEYEIVVLLQPTSPLRTGELIDKAVERFFQKQADTLATGYICKDYEWGTKNNIPRQKLKGWFYDDGNIYVHKLSHIKKGNWVGKKLERMIIDRFYNFEIDDMVDFCVVENLMKKYLS